MVVPIHLYYVFVCFRVDIILFIVFWANCNCKIPLLNPTYKLFRNVAQKSDKTSLVKTRSLCSLPPKQRFLQFVQFYLCGDRRAQGYKLFAMWSQGLSGWFSKVGAKKHYKQLQNKLQQTTSTYKHRLNKTTEKLQTATQQSTTKHNKLHRHTTNYFNIQTNTKDLNQFRHV